MAHAEFNVTSGEACENSPRRQDGAYICNIHHKMGSGIKRTRLAMGNSNPYDASMTDLATELRQRIAAEYKFIDSADKVGLQSFVGLSIVRVCVRSEHVDTGSNPDNQAAPRAERVASMAFVRDLDGAVEIRLNDTAHQRSVSEAGIGSARQFDGLRMAAIDPLLHLPITRAERDYGIHYAVPTLPATGRAIDPYVALHTMPGGEAFIERLVTLDELQ